MVLDALTYAGNRSTLKGAERTELIEGDICDRTLVDTLLTTASIDTVVNFAAESHVDRSILGPGAFVQTNVVGTFTLLDAFRQHWLAQGQPGTYRFLQVSTDEVYGSLRPTDPAFSETTPYQPNSPYAASKAGGDHLVRAYFHTYGLPTLTTHCSNNYGPFHFPEKLIPLMCINSLLGRPLPIYGDGQNVRDWIHVTDHCAALDRVIHAGQPGEAYNIGSNSEITNLDLVNQLCDWVDALAPALPMRPARDLITFVTDRPGHDRRYAINSAKVRSLGWESQVSFAAGLKQTVQWYLAHQSWWQPLLSDDYQAYYAQVYGDRKT